MKLANISNRAAIITDDGLVDVNTQSDGRFSTETDVLIGQLEAVRQWFEAAEPAVTDNRRIAELEQDLTVLGPPITRPRQIFAIGLNYRSHTAETGMTQPEIPMVFTKFASALTGPGGAIYLPEGRNDWEVELVVVIGQGGRKISKDYAIEHVAGYCIGQDISERKLQSTGRPAQFSLGKSYQGFAPIGPWLTTADEIENPGDLKVECAINGEILQSSTTAMMIFDVPALVSYLSSVCELFPGDLIFTGTPSGVGFSRTPPRYLQPGEILNTTIQGLGQLNNPCVEA